MCEYVFFCFIPFHALTSLCRHILSNVGRVASRDSSRTSATAQDLFVALCEDHSIYDLFKTMKGVFTWPLPFNHVPDNRAVYTQIEQLSKAPKPRRSKSYTRGDKQSRTSSPHQDLATGRDAGSSQSRLSAEASGVTPMAAPPVSIQNSRSSIEKTRAMKMFMANSRGSIDRDPDSYSGHRKTDSGHLSTENIKQALAVYGDSESPAFEVGLSALSMVMPLTLFILAG